MEEYSNSVKKFAEDKKSNQSLINDMKNDKSEDKNEKKFSSRNYTKFFINLQNHFSCFFQCINAISICIAFAVIALKLSYDPLSESIFTTTFNDFWSQNSLIYVLSICVPAIFLYVAFGSFLLFSLLYFKWDTIIFLLMNGSFLYSFSGALGFFVVQVASIQQLPTDSITLGFIVWNFAVLGALSIRWKAPKVLKKAYLTIFPALTCVLFINILPTTLLWMFITVISFWDIFAVLFRYGPLNLILQQLDKRDDKILVGMGYPLSVDDCDDKNDKEKNDDYYETAEKQINKDESELGLGDFLMFSLIIGIINLEGNWFLTIFCYFFIIFGMFITDMIMFFGNYRVLPALPIPIFCGMFAYYLIKAFYALLSLN